jgi:hypothetical protein
MDAINVVFGLMLAALIGVPVLLMFGWWLEDSQ